MIESALSHSSFESPLLAASALKPRGGQRKRSLFADLLLTALIDAFSILVIFLLMSFSSTGELLRLGAGVELPKAALGRDLQPAPVVRAEAGRFYLDGVETSSEALPGALLELKKKFGGRPAGAITVQADRRAKYADLSPIVAACSQAGFGDVQFAVMAK